jgi:poly(A) polymerase
MGVPWCAVPPQSAPLTEIQQRAIADLLRIAPVAVELGERFAAAGFDLALVGGSVRDALLGKLGNDLDFATNARPSEILSVVRPWADAVWDVGKAFGTIGARRGDFQLEITTYRSEVYDRTSRKPVVAFGDSLEGDLERRDFAVNAMALTLPEARFVDPYGGLADLSRKLLRTPASPEASFSDDPLRMMRAARFAAQLGFTLAAEVRQAIDAMTDRLDIVSAERVRDELVKLICAPNPRAGLQILVETGLADRMLPELPKLRLEIDEHHRHKDVYEHTLTVLEQVMALEEPDQSPDFVLRFAALMHDVGKPKTRRLEPDGRVSFHFHEVVGANLTRARMRALKFDRPTTEDVARLVELHLRFHGYGSGEWTDSAVRRYVRDAGPLLSRLHKLTRSDCTTRNRRKAEALARSYDQLEARIATLQAQEELDAIRPDLDGDEIMRLLGLQPGPLVGRARRHMLELRLDAGPMDHEAAVAALMAWWQTQPESRPDHPAGEAGTAGF